ncbi:DUF4224 domain-containing protein [Salinisphaera orenii]|uniref:DUF4224 domain-containing protein n=1 Tax=Salinisphaera orenii TaxID=856731 RepID=UPI000DBE50DC
MAAYENPLLSDDDLVDLTGYEQVSRQIRWLDKNRVPYTLRRDGRPRTTWGAYELAMSRESAGAAQPNLDALRGLA